ncbi:hypothetical protein HYPDE_41258 [Hyphomicrobium denitrificans 1NES1]|uniref:Uncharacterized protein n=1 Tax=Hyphomicrobium denitrificans 1NES1 TaxID=670307 RepID=N0BIF8_9HYPH|nr:hypothetical protein [Hyphomicrobium denitrificans]AGK59920.1 hypothetical protein HYPDE_41258 [Hyphomicrobium denitrificans 1NES1]
MIIHPQEVERLPKWARVLSTAFNKWTPQSIREAIDDCAREVFDNCVGLGRLPQKLSHNLEALVTWWWRLKMGEREWANWMREIAEDDAYEAECEIDNIGFGFGQDARAFEGNLIFA